MSHSASATLRITQDLRRSHEQKKYSDSKNEIKYESDIDIAVSDLSKELKSSLRIEAEDALETKDEYKVVTSPAPYLPPRENGYLFLEAIPDGARYVIGNQPMKSSGDIYHILAYAALARRLNYNLPTITLAYNTGDTKEQVDRSHGLVKLLGFGANIDIVKRPKSPRPSAKTADFRQYFSELRSAQYLIDQKATTIFIAKKFKDDGFETVSKFLREAFLSQIVAEASDDTYLTEIHKWVDQEFERVRKAANGKRIVLFNRRVACGANAEHDMSLVDLKEVNDILSKRDIFCWYLVADSKSSPVSKDDNETFLFKSDLPYTPEINRAIDLKGFYKLKHILLLAKLLNLPNLIGMAGNTSGTLDIAAFLGYYVYSFHKFGTSSLYLDAQDYRILSQYPFLSIGPAITKEDKFFSAWLDSNGRVPVFPELPGRKINIAGRTPYKAHEDRLPFSGALTWQYTGDTRRLDGDGIHKLKNKTDPYLVEYKIFGAVDDDLTAKIEPPKTEEKKEKPIPLTPAKLKESDSEFTTPVAAFRSTPDIKVESTPVKLAEGKSAILTSSETKKIPPEISKTKSETKSEVKDEAFSPDDSQSEFKTPRTDLLKNTKDDLGLASIREHEISTLLNPAAPSTPTSPSLSITDDKATSSEEFSFASPISFYGREVLDLQMTMAEAEFFVKREKLRQS